MSYMLLIMEPNGQRATRTEAEGLAAYEQMVGFADALKRDGLLLGAESLKSLNRSARVQRREARVEVLDGPFTEAKEMVGGYFLLDCASFAEAVEIAGRCPAARWCTVEVRELGACHDDAVPARSAA